MTVLRVTEALTSFWPVSWSHDWGKSFSCVCSVTPSCPALGTLWTVAHQAPLSMGFFRQEYWTGLPFPLPRDLPTPGIKPKSPAAPALQVDSLPLTNQGSAKSCHIHSKLSKRTYLNRVRENERMTEVMLLGFHEKEKSFGSIGCVNVCGHVYTLLVLSYKQKKLLYLQRKKVKMCFVRCALLISNHDQLLGKHWKEPDGRK